MRNDTLMFPFTIKPTTEYNTTIVVDIAGNHYKLYHQDDSPVDPTELQEVKDFWTLPTLFKLIQA